MPINESEINLFNFMPKHSYVPSQFGFGIIVLLELKDKMEMFAVQIIVEAIQSILLCSKFFFSSVLWPSLSILCTVINCAENA